MATMPNLTKADCRKLCDTDSAKFTGSDIAVTACISFVAGMLFLAVIALVLKLRREKKMCFKDPEEPFAGKWEGASQKATINVLKKHTLEKSMSIAKNKPLESSVEIRNALRESAKMSTESGEPVSELANLSTESRGKEVIAEIEEHSSKPNDDVLDEKGETRDSKHDDSDEVLSDKKMTEDEMNVKDEDLETIDDTDTQNEDKVVEHDNQKEDEFKGVNEPSKPALAVEEEEEILHKLEEKMTEQHGKDRDEGNTTELEDTEFKTDNSVVKKANHIQDSNVDDNDADDLGCKGDDEEKLLAGNCENELVVLRDSKGAELFEKDLDSVIFDPDALILQNDNFRISRKSYN